MENEIERTIEESTRTSKTTKEKEVNMETRKWKLW